LSGDAFAVVALIRGSARATESSIVASEIYRDVSAVPVPFELAFDSADIEPTVTYTLQAMIVDGANSWVTGQGVPVLTKGNPSTVDVTLAYRPDLMKGLVSGQITAVGLQPPATAYAIAVLVDPATGESLGIDVRLAEEGLPVAFGIPYGITDIDQTADYVVEAEVGDEGISWRNAGGVPVITKGNPKTGVQVVVAEVSTPTPAPTPTPTPVATAAPAPPSEPTGSGGLLTAIILLAIGAAIAVFLIARGRGQPDVPPPAASAAGAVAATEAPAPAEPDAPPPTDQPGNP
jgi:uncharacterized lipoprotein YbaY